MISSSERSHTGTTGFIVFVHCSPAVRLATCGEALLDMFLVTLAELLASRPANIGCLCARLLSCLSASASASSSPSPPARSPSFGPTSAPHPHLHLRSLSLAAGGTSGAASAFPTSALRLEPFFSAAARLAHRLADLRLAPLEQQLLQLLLVSNPGMCTRTFKREVPCTQVLNLNYELFLNMWIYTLQCQ